MSKISAYDAITSVQTNDLLAVVDVNDESMASTGTTKKMTVAQLNTEVLSQAVNLIQPSGDETGADDVAAITAAINALPSAGGQVNLAAGNWYTTGNTISKNSLSLKGAGAGTVINVLASSTAFTISNVAQMQFSDISFVLGSSALGLQVNGASNSNFANLWATGSTASGFMWQNGDDNTETTYTNCVANNVGGTAFKYSRTTDTDTGGMYYIQCRAVNPPSTATAGFVFTSTYGSESTPANIWMYQPVADSYYNSAIVIDNIRSFRAVEMWSTLNASANASQYPMHITGPGGNTTFVGGYFYQPSSSGVVVLVDGDAFGILLTGGIILDGGLSTGTGVSMTTALNVIFGEMFCYAHSLTDAPYVTASANKSAQSPVVFITQGNNGSLQCVGFDDASNYNNQMWLRNNDGTLQYLNTGFTATIGSLTQTGVWTSFISPTAGTTSISPVKFTSGSLLTTAAAGAVEYDGKVFYSTSVASSRQVTDTEQIEVLSTGYTLTSNTSAQAAFNATTNGAITLQAATSYIFECILNVTGLSATSHTVNFGFGGTATYTSLEYEALTTTTAGGTTSLFTGTAATANAITAATTGTVLIAKITGVLRINASGTVIPQLTQVTASAAGSVAAGSRFRIWPIGSNTVTSVGNWS